MQAVTGQRGITVPEGMTVNAVQAQVEKILASSGLATSERQSGLLRYLVSISLAGRGSEIKEYVLGVELFGRGDSFDPRTDAIVRTEVWRLRTKLKAYYTADGRDDPLILDLPRGSYVPVFRLREKPVTDVHSRPAAHHRERLWILAALLTAAALIFDQVFPLRPQSAMGVRSMDADDLTSVAVLPFVNSDADPELEQFADGLTEEVIENLAEIDGLRVVSRSSAFQFKGKPVDLRTVGAKLHVGSVLEGAVHRSGRHLRITARLVNAADGTQYYSHLYEHELTDAFTVQREIAAHVGNALRIRQQGDEVARFTKSADAHRLYLQGLYHASRSSESELRQAIDYFQRALAYDRDYAPAYASLSDAYIVLALLNEATPRAVMQRAEDAARSAVKTGNTFAHAHAALGSVLALYEWDWAGAQKEFRKAIEEDPNDSVILQQYAMRYLVPQTYLDSALFELQIAQQVDPFSPQVMLNRGRVQYFKRDPEHALRAFHSALDLDPHLEVAPLALAEAYLQSSMFDEASKTLQESSQPTEDEARLAVLGRVYGLSRQAERAQQVLQQLVGVAPHQRVSGYYFSQVHLALGETSTALDWLEKAAEERSPLIVYVKVAAVRQTARGAAFPCATQEDRIRAVRSEFRRSRVDLKVRKILL
jgi:TolB-like protein/Tfp pilus assembly protein PilF